MTRGKRHANRCRKGMVSLTLALALVVSSLSLPVWGEQAPETITGTYQFTSCKDDNRQLTDEFVWRDDCFTRSSYLGCSHLTLLSAQAAQASASYYGPEVDHFEVDCSDASHNIREMLESMGFTDYAENDWYNREKQENSMGVAVAVRQISAGDEEYTLLAIVPRSAGYKREWVGDFTIGGGNIHEGFKQARDEVLRFVRQYMEENEVQGALKVWTMGHSRGGAVANMVAAFFAGGGIGYFGDQVSIAPEDVYCFGFATPRMIKAGTKKAEELSVSAQRGDEYAVDTPGEEWISDAEGELDPQEEIYGGIRNYPLDYDLVTLLPPEKWGFTYYGQVCRTDGDGLVSVADMLEELKVLSPVKYEAALESGSPDKFAWQTFDLQSFQFTEPEDVPAEDIGGFLEGRVNGLIYNVPTNEMYAETSVQEAMQALASVYGLMMNNLNGIVGDSGPGLIRAGVYSCLAYASERLIEEGRAKSEEEAVLIILGDVLEALTGKRPEKTDFTVDDFFGILVGYIADHEDSPIVERMYSRLNKVISGRPEMVMRLSLMTFTKKEEALNASLADLVKNYLRACAYGPDPECPAAQTFKDAAAVRGVFYGLSAMILSLPAVSSALGWLGGLSLKADTSFLSLVQVIREALFTKEDEEAGSVWIYSSFAEAADEALAESVGEVLGRAVDQTAGLYGEEYHDAAAKSVATLTENIGDVRRLLLYGLFFTEGEDLSVEAMVRNACTFAKNAQIMFQAHPYETYTAWARAVDRKDKEEH